MKSDPENEPGIFSSVSEPSAREGRLDPIDDGEVDDGENGEENSADFDWTRDDSVVLQTQPAIAVYINPKDGIVIRSESLDRHEPDSYVVLASVGAAYRVIDAINRQLAILKALKGGAA